jgi:N-acetylmuramoyl-L-alanine amidase
MKLRFGATILLLACALSPAVAAADRGSARELYTRTLEREQALRRDDAQVTLLQMRSIVGAYDAIVRRFPASGYSDNALWQGGNLALLAFQRFGQAADRRTAERLLNRLKEQYPSSSLGARVDGALDAADADVSASPAAVAPLSPVPTHAADSVEQKAVGTSAAVDAVQVPAPVLIRDIKRSAMPEGMRVTIEMDAEAAFRAERLENPRRVFFDLKGTRAVPSLLDATLRYSDDIVREIRLGRHPKATTRIVFDMQGVDSYSVFTLYSPYRLVIDFKPQTDAETRTDGPRTNTDTHGNGAPRTNPDTRSVARGKTVTYGDVAVPGDIEKRAVNALPTRLPAAAMPAPSLPVLPLPPPGAGKIAAEPLPEQPVVTPAPPAPALPAANLDGKFSLSRQLGLGISRVVIDAGHGGHDPGAQSNGVSESELTLDVALRLSRLLQKHPGIEVVMTRGTDVFVPLEERTAMANREGADLFLSIHANASRDPRARGVETYFLNFASNPDAEAVAARENSASGRAMHSLPDIVRAIALNNKIDESRDFADMVQRSMVRRLSSRNKQLKDLGVKQAPFVVLIGAAMPSVLAEISFVTHRQEGQLLKSQTYRQQIAEALFDAVLRYQQSLKKPRVGVLGLGAR